MLVEIPLGDAIVERRIETVAEGRELYSIPQLVARRTFLMALSWLGALMLSTLWLSHMCTQQI